MADISTNYDQLKFEFMFVDGDTRIQTLKNPKANVTSAEIEELNAFIRANNLVIGDKGAATFGKIKQVKKITGTTTQLDLS